MTLLIMLTAAIIVTVVWYRGPSGDGMKISVLCYLYWGASLMWMTDALFEYAELGADYFTPALADMLNDAFLGLAAVVFGLVIWLVILLVKDPACRLGGAKK